MTTTRRSTSFTISMVAVMFGAVVWSTAPVKGAGLRTEADAVEGMRRMISTETRDTFGIAVTSARCRRPIVARQTLWDCTFERATSPSWDSVFVEGRGRLWLQRGRIHWRFTVTNECAGDCNQGPTHPAPLRTALQWRGSVLLETIRCPEVVLFNSDGTVYTGTKGLSATRVRCTLARAVARDFLMRAEGNPEILRPFRFRCTYRRNGIAVRCQRGGQIVSWRFYFSGP